MKNKNDLIKRYRKIESEFDSIRKEVEEYFYPLAKEAVERNDIQEAKRILMECPDNVTAAFIADLIHYH